MLADKSQGVVLSKEELANALKDPSINITFFSNDQGLFHVPCVLPKDYEKIKEKSSV